MKPADAAKQIDDVLNRYTVTPDVAQVQADAILRIEKLLQNIRDLKGESAEQMPEFKAFQDLQHQLSYVFNSLADLAKLEQQCREVKIINRAYQSIISQMESELQAYKSIESLYLSGKLSGVVETIKAKHK